MISSANDLMASAPTETTDKLFFMIKLVFITAYILFGVLSLVQSQRQFRLVRAGARAMPKAPLLSPLLPTIILPLMLAGLMVARFAQSGSNLLLAAVALGTLVFALLHAAWRRPRMLLPAIAAAAVVLSLVWWRIAPSEAAPLPLLAFTIILALLAAGFADPWRNLSGRPVLAMGLFLVAGLLLSLDLGAYRSGVPFTEMMAHHWGAFIGPALHVRAGLAPFYDIPLQYGLGPTLAIAAACRENGCWSSSEALIVVMNMASAMLLLRMALAASRPRGWVWQGAVTVVMFAALFLWTGFPSEGNGVLAFPSVGGLRFLPAVLLTALLFFSFPVAAMGALALAVLWSPESAAMGIVVYGLCETGRIGVFGAALRTALILAGSYAALFLVHHAVFGIWLEPAALLEYVLHVPGELPIYPISDAILLVAVFALGAWLLLRTAVEPVAAHRDRTIVFLLFAASSYWLGRSHPNNICNLMPFMVLVALRVLDLPANQRSLLADTTGLGLAVSVGALAFSPWRTIPYDPSAITDMSVLVNEFGSLEPGIAEIRRQIANPGGLGIADLGPTFVRNPRETLVWTPIDPGSLWSYVPSERRQLYIRRSAARLGRSGWAIFDEEEAGLLFADMQAGYTIAQQHTFDGPPSKPGGPPMRYLVVCFDPRADLVAAPVGPPCPSAEP